MAWPESDQWLHRSIADDSVAANRIFTFNPMTWAKGVYISALGTAEDFPTLSYWRGSGKNIRTPEEFMDFVWKRFKKAAAGIEDVDPDSVIAKHLNRHLAVIGDSNLADAAARKKFLTTFEQSDGSFWNPAFGELEYDFVIRSNRDFDYVFVLATIARLELLQRIKEGDKSQETADLLKAAGAPAHAVNKWVRGKLATIDDVVVSDGQTLDLILRELGTRLAAKEQAVADDEDDDADDEEAFEEEDDAQRNLKSRNKNAKRKANPLVTDSETDDDEDNYTEDAHENRHTFAKAHGLKSPPPRPMPPRFQQQQPQAQFDSATSQPPRKRRGAQSKPMGQLSATAADKTRRKVVSHGRWDTSIGGFGRWYGPQSAVRERIATLPGGHLAFAVFTDLSAVGDQVMLMAQPECMALSAKSMFRPDLDTIGLSHRFAMADGRAPLMYYGFLYRSRWSRDERTVYYNGRPVSGHILQWLSAINNDDASAAGEYRVELGICEQMDDYIVKKKPVWAEATATSSSKPTSNSALVPQRREEAPLYHAKSIAAAAFATNCDADGDTQMNDDDRDFDRRYQHNNVRLPVLMDNAAARNRFANALAHPGKKGGAKPLNPTAELVNSKALIRLSTDNLEGLDVEDVSGGAVLLRTGDGQEVQAENAVLARLLAMERNKLAIETPLHAFMKVRITHSPGGAQTDVFEALISRWNASRDKFWSTFKTQRMLVLPFALTWFVVAILTRGLAEAMRSKSEHAMDGLVTNMHALMHMIHEASMADAHRTRQTWERFIGATLTGTPLESSIGRARMELHGASNMRRWRGTEADMKSDSNVHRVCRQFNFGSCVRHECERAHECCSCGGGIRWIDCTKSSHCGGKFLKRATEEAFQRGKRAGRRRAYQNDDDYRPRPRGRNEDRDEAQPGEQSERGRGRGRPRGRGRGGRW